MRVCVRTQGSATEGTANCGCTMPLNTSIIPHYTIMEYITLIVATTTPTFSWEYYRLIWRKFDNGSQKHAACTFSVLEVPVFDTAHFANNSQIKPYRSLICHNSVTTTASQQQCHNNSVTTTASQQQRHNNSVTTTVSQQQRHNNSVTTTVSQQQCHNNSVTTTASQQQRHNNSVTTEPPQQCQTTAS